MTATLEAEVKQKLNEDISNFTMPRPSRGQCIAWYPNGTRGDSETAFVLSVGKRNIVLRTATGIPMETVRHIDDPKLQLNAEQRASGAWDFTEHDKKMNEMTASLAGLKATVETLTARVVELEAFINEPAKKNK